MFCFPGLAKATGPPKVLLQDESISITLIVSKGTSAQSHRAWAAYAGKAGAGQQHGRALKLPHFLSIVPRSVIWQENPAGGGYPP